MGGSSILAAERYTDRDLIESILSSYFIVDYGFIKTVNEDSSVDVVHAKQLKTLDGKNLNATITKRIEMLTLSAAGFALKVDYKKGDKVLLLGLKDYVPKTAEVTQATETTAYMHYTRETLKAIPLCLFNNDAKVKIEVEEGTLKATTENNIELNGNDKQFVTYQELDNALQELWTKIKAHTHPVSTTGTAAAQSGTAASSTELASVTLDISAAKTTTILTGG